MGHSISTLYRRWLTAPISESYVDRNVTNLKYVTTSSIGRPDWKCRIQAPYEPCSSLSYGPSMMMLRAPYIDQRYTSKPTDLASRTMPMIWPSHVPHDSCNAKRSDRQLMSRPSYRLLTLFPPSPFVNPAPLALLFIVPPIELPVSFLLIATSPISLMPAMLL